MLGIGSTELVIILVFGFLLFGPDKLPQMGRTIGRALRQFRETQEKLTAVVQTEVVDPMAAAAKAPKVAVAAEDEDADAEGSASTEEAPVRKETFAERRARLAAERAAKEAEAAADDAEDGKSAPAEDAPADEPEPESEQLPEEAPEPEVLTTEDLYARRPRKRAAAPAAEAEAAPVEDESKGGEQ
ncbi:twin-arginine translocase TatA/TatE family subunit [Collinsella intestinalis]|uniref:Sec-independent protein translocase subunit TatA/TatB n=1 Tax=Collinsella intestinalis TaxID=147207 RepID=UPI0015FE33CE|nr:twin-arginine translocase TatA/TatE family subunit [Collinsella intestinalis]